MKKAMNWLVNEESGQGMVEYGLILAAIAITVIVILNAIGGKLSNKFNDVSNNLD
ncbi:MAG: Flp family type IVb pilin [Lachnospiraceae bacterium]|nr:Flp family type IVb pilin [Lachnospiraceae bacterium]